MTKGVYLAASLEGVGSVSGSPRLLVGAICAMCSRWGTILGAVLLYKGE